MPGAYVHTDLLNSLYDDAKGMVETMMPEKDSAPPEKALAFSQMESFLLSSLEWAVPAKHLSHCVTHRRWCPVSVPWLVNARLGGQTLEEIRSPFPGEFPPSTESAAQTTGGTAPLFQVQSIHCVSEKCSIAAGHLFVVSPHVLHNGNWRKHRWSVVSSQD